METYKPIKRRYITDSCEIETAYFIARGQWANGKLAYSMCDENGNVFDELDCAYIQYRDFDGFIMEHI